MNQVKDWARRGALLVAGCVALLALSASPGLCAAGPAAPAMSLDQVGAKLEVGSDFTVHIANLGANIASGFNPLSVDLRVQGKELTNLGKVIDGKANTITFSIQRRPEDRAAWQALLGSPSSDTKPNVVIGVGPAGQADFTYAAANAPTTTLVLFHPIPGFVIVALLEAGLVVIIGGLALKTGLLRDGNPGVANWAQRPFSLARCQMAFWLVLITGAFLFVWGLTGEYDGIITPQSLVLLGISGATALGATAIDTAKAAGQAASTPAPAPAAPAPAVVPAAPAAAGPPTHDNFFADLLTDDSGYTLQRVQAFAWTLILGVVVVRSVYANLSLPALDNNLLTLMGISSGLYVGFKFPEQQTGAPPAGP